MKASIALCAALASFAVAVQSISPDEPQQLRAEPKDEDCVMTEYIDWKFYTKCKKEAKELFKTFMAAKRRLIPSMVARQRRKRLGKFAPLKQRFALKRNEV